jgi:aminoglycoside/choline kinase family phosphotransferase
LPARPIPEDLTPWALAILGTAEHPGQVSLAPVAGDASNRRYFRLRVYGEPYILLEAPPTTEKNVEFLAVREVLEAAGLCVPRLYGADLQRGYLLLGDLGDRLLLSELNDGSVDSCYRQAFSLLRRLQALAPPDPDWPVYDEALLQEELGRFPQWFAGALLGHAMTADEMSLWRRLCCELVGSALAQPKVLVHRDFHSRNLMPQADGQLAVIDFQDAVYGPLTYDLVSLLRDCYIRWPAHRVEAWALDYLAGLRAAGTCAEVADGEFLHWFDLMGLQRHLKVLGTFARLYLRDGKRSYLEDLPLVIDYVLEILDRYAARNPDFADFATWFRGTLGPLVAAQDWSVPT